MIAETVIDTDSPGFRAAVAIRRTTLAFRDLRDALEDSQRQEIAWWRAIDSRRATRQRAFDRAVVEAVGR